MKPTVKTYAELQRLRRNIAFIQKSENIRPGTAAKVLGRTKHAAKVARV